MAWAVATNNFWAAVLALTLPRLLAAFSMSYSHLLCTLGGARYADTSKQRLRELSASMQDSIYWLCC